MNRAWVHRLSAAARRETSYVRAQAQGLARPGSHQRLHVRQIAKATLAAVLAWLLASRLLPTEATWIAPATAVIMVHATVYQTLTNGLRRVAAVAAGVILAGSIGHLLGLGVLSLILVVPPALVAARWHRMGRYGSDVATTAVLMLSFGAASQDRYLAAYVVATAAGALCGAIVNTVLWPPLYRDRPNVAVRRLAREVSGLLTAIANGLRDGWDLSALPDWKRQAHRLDEYLATATSAVADSAESHRYNLRHRLRRRPRADRPDTGHDQTAQQTLQMLARLATHVRAIVHALFPLDHHSTSRAPVTTIQDVSHDYARDYADLLDLLADTLTSTSARGGDPVRTRILLGRARAQAARIHEQMTSQIRHGHVNHPTGWALSGSLLTDADRILAILADGHTPSPRESHQDRCHDSSDGDRSTTSPAQRPPERT
ncbi:FUSC family protein [Nonomuraea sp. NPDC049625]|uniref:FUSC family protein n=1 Tax=Nonomuraea sp. NPDC049625 TaxID=3155775 RepID=UPI0034252F62